MKEGRGKWARQPQRSPEQRLLTDTMKSINTLFGVDLGGGAGLAELEGGEERCWRKSRDGDSFLGRKGKQNNIVRNLAKTKS